MGWTMRLEGVGRRYGAAGPWVLRGVELEVRAGELLRIEGPNGGGKSTLLRMLAGIEAPSAGRITGRPAVRGYVPERFPPALPLTALGYLTHLGRVRGLRTRAAAHEGRGWLERLGAGEFAGTRLRELSKGSSQKVAVAQALLGRPELLVLDEAWTGLDGPARAALDDVVRARVREGAAVVYVDHDPQRLARPGRAAYRVERGRLVDAGLRGGAWTRIEAERPGGGPPPRALSDGALPDAALPGGELPDGALPDGAVCERAADGSVSLTVRAADSDETLRALLTASPPWHVRAVREHKEPR